VEAQGIRNFVPALTGIRGLAVLSVLIFHGNEARLPGGFLGVDVFFVLSGFLITTVLIKEHDTAGRISLRDFWMRRVLRLAPALVLMLCVVLALSFFLRSDSRAFRSDAFEVLLALFYLANWARAFGFHPHDVLPHTWSLSVEEQFYLLWPLILIPLLKAPLPRRKLAALVLAGAILISLYRVALLAAGESIHRLSNGLDTRADGLLIGCSLALALSAAGVAGSNPRFHSVVLRSLLGPAALAGLAILALIAEPVGRQTCGWQFLAVAILSAALLYDSVGPKSLLRPLLENPFLVWVGSISYGLYLWHLPIFVVFDYTENEPWKLAVGAPLTFAAASVSYYLIEQPALRLKSRFRGKPCPQSLARRHTTEARRTLELPVR